MALVVWPFSKKVFNVFFTWLPIHAGCFDRLTRLSTCERFEGEKPE